MTGGPWSAAAGPGDVARERRARAVLWGFVAAVTVLRLAYLAAGILDLSPDEAHYWEWSRRLDAAYYSKGPLIAYLIYGLTATLGASAFSIRLGAILLSVAGALLLYRLGREAFGDARVGLLAVVGLELTPLFWAGSLLMTIDSPFLVCWTLALLFLYRGAVGGVAGAWILAGLAVGLGLLAKYTMLFVLPGIVVYLWCAPEARRRVRHPASWVGAALALGLLVPVLVWNLRHGWVTARHVASQGRGAGLGWEEPLAFLGSQVGVLTPVVAAILGWAAWRALRDGLIGRREPYRFLAAFALPILAFYALLSVQGKIQANWPAAAYPPLALIAAGALLERRPAPGAAARRAQTALLVGAGAVALAVTALGHATDLLGLPPGLDPTTRLKGWRELGGAVAAARGEMPAPERTFLLSDRYQVTSELAFYVPDRPPAYNVNLGRRLNQYDFWEGPGARLGWDAIYVEDGVGRPLDMRVAAAFERIEGPSVLEVRRGGRVVRAFAIYRAYGFRGVAAPSATPRY